MTQTEDIEQPFRRAVSYIRVNRGAVGNNTAVQQQVDWQRQRCQAVAEERGLTLVEEYRDDTGAIHVDQRPGLRRLLEETSARYIIVADLARLSRNVRILTAIEQQLRRTGRRLLVYGEGPEQEGVRRRIAAVLADFDPKEERRHAR